MQTASYATGSCHRDVLPTTRAARLLFFHGVSVWQMTDRWMEEPVLEKTEEIATGSQAQYYMKERLLSVHAHKRDVPAISTSPVAASDQTKMGTMQFCRQMS